MSLSLLLDPNPKPWCNINCNNINSTGSTTVTGDVLLPATNAALTQGVIKIDALPFVHNYSQTNDHNNTFVGANAGLNAPGMLAASTRNTGNGERALSGLTTGSDSTCIGWRAGQLLSSAIGNTLTGSVCGGNNVITGNNNTGNGSFCLANLTSGVGNNGVGAGSLVACTTGSTNNALGAGAGSVYTTENNNIVIANVGVVGDAGRIRIGTNGVATFSHIEGIPVTHETSTPAGPHISAASFIQGIADVDNVAVTIDTGAQFDAAFPQLQVGEVLKCLVTTNNTPLPSAIAGGGGVTFSQGVNNNIPPLSSRLLYLRKTNVATYVIY